MATSVDRLTIESPVLDEINRFLLNPDNQVVQALLKVVDKYGTPDEINARAREARSLPRLMARLEEMNSPYLKDLRWLIEERDHGAFVTMEDYRKRVLGAKAAETRFDEKYAVTLGVIYAVYVTLNIVLYSVNPPPGDQPSMIMTILFVVLAIAIPWAAAVTLWRQRARLA